MRTEQVGIARPGQGSPLRKPACRQTSSIQGLHFLLSLASCIRVVGAGVAEGILFAAEQDDFIGMLGKMRMDLPHLANECFIIPFTNEMQQAKPMVRTEDHELSAFLSFGIRMAAQAILMASPGKKGRTQAVSAAPSPAWV